MSDTINNNLESLRNLFEQTQLALEENFKNKPEGEKLQVPVLLGMMAVQLNWNEEQVRQNDPLVRFHVRNHPDWYVTRGSGGGIMRASEKQKKDALKLAKDLAKKQMTDALEAKAAAAQSSEVSSSNE